MTRLITEVEVYDLIEVKHMRTTGAFPLEDNRYVEPSAPVEYWRVCEVRAKPSKDTLHVYYTDTEENAMISDQHQIRRYNPDPA